MGLPNMLLHVCVCACELFECKYANKWVEVHLTGHISVCAAADESQRPHERQAANHDVNNDHTVRIK